MRIFTLMRPILISRSLKLYLKATWPHQGAKLLRGALERGFTSVRDVGGADYGLWRATEEGLIPSPRLFYGGRALSQTGGHADIRGAHINLALAPTCQAILA